MTIKYRQTRVPQGVCDLCITINRPKGRFCHRREKELSYRQNMRSKSLKVVLLDGTPYGVKTAELSNWNGKAIITPRAGLKN